MATSQMWALALQIDRRRRTFPVLGPPSVTFTTPLLHYRTAVLCRSTDDMVSVVLTVIYNTAHCNPSRSAAPLDTPPLAGFVAALPLLAGTLDPTLSCSSPTRDCRIRSCAGAPAVTLLSLRLRADH